MGMALKVDVAQACKCSGAEKPIDLVHLSRLTMGDKALELDVLKMFLAHIPNYIEMIKSAKSEGEIYMAAHTLKGAARNVGAFQLADIAGEAEKNNEFSMKSILHEMGEIADYISILASE